MTGSGMLHLCSGDMGHLAWAAARLPGRALIWRDSPAVGPWHSDPALRTRLRTQFWELPEGSGMGLEEEAAFSALRQAEAAVLWFSEEPWDQLAQLWVVAELTRSASCPGLACVLLKEGGSAVPPAVLHEIFAQRLPLAPGDREEAVRVWDLFEAEAWTGLRAWLDRKPALPTLPFLARALARVLEDRPPSAPGRTERQVQELMASGIRDLPAMMGALARLEAPYGLAWYGDLLVKNLMDRSPAQGEAG